MVRLGVETLVDSETEVVADQRVGLITNPSGVDSSLSSTIDILYNHDDVHLTRLFAPEHGIRGNRQAGVNIEDGTDDRTGVPVLSLYGDDRRLTPEMVSDIDLLIYDMQDIGCRFYTLIYTLAYALEGCSQADIPFVVLDRPNPIAPLGVDGNRVPAGTSSFVGGRQLPITHSMTVGELALYFNDRFEIDADLTVVELDGWARNTWYDELNIAWVPPSPNMPTLETASIYPGTCLFEGTTLSEGRGTTKPFEVVGAPWIDAQEWASVLNTLDISGTAFRPAYFSPMFSKHERRNLEGVQIHIMDRDQFAPVEVGVKMLITAFQQYPETEWINSNGGHFIDNLAGGPWLREAINECEPTDSPSTVYERIRDRWTDDLASFGREFDRYAIYQ